MAKICFTRQVVTAVFGPVQPGDIHEAREDTAERYVSAGWAERVVAPKPAKKAASK